MNARKVFVGLWLTVTLTCWAAVTPLFASDTSVVVAVDSIGMTVSDMDRSVAFYSDVKVLGFGKGFLVRDPDGYAIQIVSP